MHRAEERDEEKGHAHRKDRAQQVWMVAYIVYPRHGRRQQIAQGEAAPHRVRQPQRIEIVASHHPDRSESGSHRGQYKRGLHLPGAKQPAIGQNVEDADRHQDRQGHFKADPPVQRRRRGKQEHADEGDYGDVQHTAPRQAASQDKRNKVGDKHHRRHDVEQHGSAKGFRVDVGQGRDEVEAEPGGYGDDGSQSEGRLNGWRC